MLREGGTVIVENVKKKSMFDAGCSTLKQRCCPLWFKKKTQIKKQRKNRKFPS